MGELKCRAWDKSFLSLENESQEFCGKGCGTQGYLQEEWVVLLD